MKPTLSIQLPSNQPQAQPVYVGHGLLAQLPELLKEQAPGYRYAIITDSVVENLYGEKLLSTLNAAGLPTELFSFEAGESSKNESTYSKLCSALLERNYGRDTVLIALGGGVVGDLTGFIAATYLRGIPFVQVPTTVLAMVDSSIGGKVGIDTPHGKNLIGAFWHPRMIVADLDVLESLSQEQIQNGWFEAIKMFACMDKNAYENFTKGDSAELLQRAMELKIQVIQTDEREAGLRSILNFGHSIGHALELLSHYTLPHGFAIALGMLVEGRASVNLGHLSEVDWNDIGKVLKANGLSKTWLHKVTFDDVWKAMQIDKKNRENEVRIVLLKSLGEVFEADRKIIHSIQKSELEKAWNDILNT